MMVGLPAEPHGTLMLLYEVHRVLPLTVMGVSAILVLLITGVLYLRPVRDTQSRPVVHDGSDLSRSRRLNDTGNID